jgi:hypothetical protein
MERFWIWLAWRLPRQLAYWAMIRVAAEASTGKYAHVEAPALLVVDALQRWNDETRDRRLRTIAEMEKCR